MIDNTHNYSRSALPYLLILFSIALLFEPLNIRYYTPTSDGWVFSVQYENIISHSSFIDILNRLFSIQDSRSFRLLPFLIQKYSGIEGFLLLNTILFILYVATICGIYKIFSIYTSNYLSIFLALVFGLFPFDGTLFFSGAFGVNISLFAVVWSFYLIISYSNYSGSIFKFISGLILIFVANKSYPGHIPLYFLCISLHFIVKIYIYKETWHRQLKLYATLFIIYFISLLPFIYEIMQGSGRSSVVADVDIFSALFGLVYALKTSLVDATVSALDWDAENSLACALFFTLSTTSFLLLKCELQIPNVRRIVYVFLLSGLIFAAGYFPYSVTELRYNNARELLFARFGVCVFIAAIILLAYSRYRHYLNSFSCALLFSVVLTLFLNQKITVAEFYAENSREQRFFLSEVAKLVPDGSDTNQFLIFVDAEKAVVRTPSMIINRPEWMLRYLFEENDIQAVAVNYIQFRKGLVEYYIDSNQLARGRNRVSLAEAVPLNYTPGVGVTIANDLSLVDASLQTRNLDVRSVSPFAAGPRSPRVDWFTRLEH